MGKSKYLDDVMTLFEKSPVVDFKSIKRIVGNKKDDYAKLLVHNLLKSEKIFRVTKGHYSKDEDSSLVVFCFSPAYLGLQNALSFHGLWEQETVPIVVTSKIVREGVRKVFGTNVLLKRAKKWNIFGFEYYLDGNYYLPYSDIEKTFIDMFFYGLSMSKEVMLEFKRKIDLKKLGRYLKNYDKSFREKVLKVLEN